MFPARVLFRTLVTSVCQQISELDKLLDNDPKEKFNWVNTDNDWEVLEIIYLARTN